MTRRKYNRAYWMGEASHEAAAPVTESPDIVPIDLDGLDEWREKIKNGSLPFKVDPALADLAPLKKLK